MEVYTVVISCNNFKIKYLLFGNVLFMCYFNLYVYLCWHKYLQFHQIPVFEFYCVMFHAHRRFVKLSLLSFYYLDCLLYGTVHCNLNGPQNVSLRQMHGETVISCVLIKTLKYIDIIKTLFYEDLRPFRWHVKLICDKRTMH